MVVERIPKFGHEKEVGAFDYAFFDGAGDALAGFLFVAVVWEYLGCGCLKTAETLCGRKFRRLTTCTVKETVARLDGIIDSIGTGVIVDFPKPGQKISMLSGTRRDGHSPKANKGHLMAAVELDVWGRHAGVRSECGSLEMDW